MENSSFLSFKEHINKLSPISQQIWNEVKTILTTRKLKKEEFIVKKNEIYNQEIFIHQGVVRGFYCSGEGEEFNVAFYQGNELICPWFARNINERSNINLQALIPAIIVEMDQDAMKFLRYKYTELFLYGNLVVENELNKKMQREIYLLMKNAEERYLQFRKEYPNLENKISQYHVASFLNITPVSLSRLRKNLAKR